MSRDALGPSNSSNWRTLALASLGGALEFYDFVVFVFFTGVIGNLFFPSDIPLWSRQLQTYGLFAVGYLARPLGGVIMAHFGDTKGRKQMFMLSVLLMTLPTLVIAGLPTYRSIGVAAPLLLLIMRVMQGAAIGGEAPGGWVFVGEHARPGGAGFAVGLLTAGLSAGILLGSLIATALNACFTPVEISHGAWRIPFALGGAFGLIAAFLRRWLTETPVFLSLRARTATARQLPLRIILAAHKGAVIRSFLLTWMLTADIVVVILMTPSLLHQLRGLPLKTVQTANLFATAGLCLSTVAVGAACDRFGIRRVAFFVIPPFVAASYLLYLYAGRSPSHLLAWYSLAGLGSGCVVLTPLAMLCLFPAAVRFTGFSFSYNIAYAIFGGLAPVLVSSLSRMSPLAAAHYVAMVSLIGLLALVGLPSTKAEMPAS